MTFRNIDEKELNYLSIKLSIIKKKVTKKMKFENYAQIVLKKIKLMKASKSI